MIVERIARDTGLAPAYIDLVARSATHRYKTYRIRKRTEGFRTIHHPARELKLFQEWLCENLFTRLPIHSAAQAYRKGSSIARNAALHAAQNYLLRVDFQDFFPSIRRADVIEMLGRNHFLLSLLMAFPQDMEIVANFACREGRLTIGSPCSPVLSNAVMYLFDDEWSKRCRQRDVVFSRYADDLYFSTDRPNLLQQIMSELREDLRHRESPRLLINETKTVFTSRKHKRLVTGLTLTSTKQVSLGRHRKRWIKSMIFEYWKRNLAPEKLQYLRGILSFARSVDPAFVRSLQRKYGYILYSILPKEASGAKRAAD